MTNFAPVAFLDTFDLAASLRQRAGLFLDRGGGLREMPVRGFRKDTAPDDEMFVTYPTPTKWVDLANIRIRLKQIGDQALGTVEFGRIWFEMLDPGARLPWTSGFTSGYAERWASLNLPVRTNPGAMMYAGTESAHLLPGQVTVVNRRVVHSAINLGEWPRVHLICEFRKKDDAPAQA